VDGVHIRMNKFARVAVAAFIPWLLLSRISISQDAAKYIALDPKPTHATGFVREDPKKYGAVKPIERFRAFYPPAWDLSDHLPAAGNQGRQPSCVAWAVGYAARTYYRAKDYDADTRQAENILSPAYIYNSTRQTRGDCSEGTSISEALDLLKRNGGVPLTALPYNPQQCSSVPDSQALGEYADRFKIEGYRSVDGRNEDDVKGQIYSGNVIIFAIDVPKPFDGYRADSPTIDDTDDRGMEFGHAMVIVGYDDGKQAYHFLNSWGPQWGEHGFGWISYRSVAALWLAGFVMQVAPPPAPPPAPSPEPAPAPAPIVAPPVIDAGAECGRVNADTLKTDAGFTVKLSGFVGRAEDLERIRAAAGAQPGVVSVDAADVTLRPWPQCEALLTLDKALHNDSGLRVSKVPDQSRFVKGERMIFEVQSPNYPSYLYVAYIQADGTAAHLVRPNGDGLTAAGTKIRLGDQQGQPKYRVGAPYGHEMVVALASRQPLLDESLLGEVRERDLLTAYRRVLLGPEAKSADAAFVVLETAEQ
jgi:hypothetical protein